jgi:hypothetical protein
MGAMGASTSLKNPLLLHRFLRLYSVYTGIDLRHINRYIGTFAFGTLYVHAHPKNTISVKSD